ncbi:MAG: pilus assembly protein TadG-related protein [Erythrobacter sp.]
MSAFKNFCKKLRNSTSGNAALLVGLGMPVLVGGTGYAVDTAQWYLYKRELQYAADQGALAGAWARGNGDTGSGYITRAEQEFDDNISVTSGYTPVDAATLEDYDSGTLNSVVVTATMTVDLPFSQIVLERPTTISVRSQAIYETVAAYNPCILAVKPSGSDAVWFNGGPNVNAACGVGAVSDSDDAVSISGNSGTYNVGFVVTAGTVLDRHDGFAGADVVENSEGVFDPFEDLTPPNNPTAQTLSCGGASDPWTADETQTESYTYVYYQGRNSRQAERAGTITYTGAGMSTSTPTSITTVGATYSAEPVANSSSVTGGLVQIAGSGRDSIWEQATTTTSYTYANVTFTASTGTQQPGTYADFDLSCDTTLAGGIYVIDGGTLKVNASYSLTGNGVMFVLKNGADIQINGGASINLSAMTKNELLAAYSSPAITAEAAEELAGMLIFEHPDSAGSDRAKINGNSSTSLNGTIYMPNSTVELLGSAKGTSACLMLAAGSIKIGGTADLSTFCPPGDTIDTFSVNGGTRVRLVA